MTEHRLFHIFIRPKDEQNLDYPVVDFRFLAETPVDALAKMMKVPDIDYMYDPWNTKIVIEYEGVVY
jgi:hypothetical protein